MKYLPTAVLASDLDIAQAPYFGGEFAAYLSRVASVDLGQVTLTASGTGTGANASWTPALAVSIKSGGADLQLVADTDLRSPSGPCVVVFNVLNDTNAAATLTFTFSTPARVPDQSSNFPRGVATDGVLSVGTKTKSIVGVASVTNGDENVTFSLFQLPEAADYVLVGCTTEKKFSPKARQPVGIDCGMESDAFVKRGKTNKGELTLDSKFGGIMDRLTRFNGARTTCMLVGIKDGQVTHDKLVFTQYVPGVTVTLPDGESEAMENAATGKFVNHLFFVAP